MKIAFIYFISPYIILFEDLSYFSGTIIIIYTVAKWAADVALYLLLDSCCACCCIQDNCFDKSPSSIAEGIVESADYCKLKIVGSSHVTYEKI